MTEKQSKIAFNDQFPTIFNKKNPKIFKQLVGKYLRKSYNRKKSAKMSINHISGQFYGQNNNFTILATIFCKIFTLSALKPQKFPLTNKKMRDSIRIPHLLYYICHYLTYILTNGFVFCISRLA